MADEVTIEQVARALCNSAAGYLGAAACRAPDGRPAWQAYVERARIALAAVAVRNEPAGTIGTH